jgi:exo-beta-1,3-glucanase (GH17 family)
VAPGQLAVISSLPAWEEAVSRPQVIDDQEHERVHERVAAAGVAKDTGMVCTRTPHPSRPGARRSTIWTVAARMGAVRALGRQLREDGIEIVTLESTSDYWRIWVRHEAHCCIARSAGGNRRRCFSDLMAYQGPKG